jgi:hypothetical protein
MVTMKVVPVSDTQANNLLPWQLIRHHSLSFAPYVKSASDYMYYPNPNGGFYSNFPVGTSFLALPVYLVPSLFISEPASTWMAYLGKTSAAAMMALASVLMYLTAARLFRDRRTAILLAVIFALGTGVFSMCSQMLLTFSGAILSLITGTYLLVRYRDSRETGWKWLLPAGFAFAYAGFCQPVAFIFLAVFGLYVLVNKARDLFAYSCGAVLPLFFFFGYNWYCYGSPLTTGEHLIPLMNMTGSWDIRPHFTRFWNTPLWKGLSGQLFSPSRGILVWTPVFLFAFLGVYLALRMKGRYSILTYGFIGVVLTVILASMWFDWTGYNSYGPRITATVIPFMVLLIGPCVPRIRKNKVLLATFALLLAFSIFVQAVGYISYDGGSWERRFLYKQTWKPEEMRVKLVSTEDNMWSGNNQLFWELSNISFYVPEIWQGSYPANVSKIVDQEILNGDHNTAASITTVSPRIFRLSAQICQGDKVLLSYGPYITPRGTYKTVLSPLEAEKSTDVTLKMGVSNIGLEDGYFLKRVIHAGGP